MLNSRISRFSFIGKCYYSSGKFNEAIENLKKAADSINRMNQTKKNTYYSLAKCHEAANQVQEANSCYKAIFAVDENYKDISKIIDKAYQREIMENL